MPPLEAKESGIVTTPPRDRQFPAYFLRPILGLPKVIRLDATRDEFPSGQYLITVGKTSKSALHNGLHRSIEPINGLRNILIPISIIGDPKDRSIIDRNQTFISGIPTALRNNHPSSLPTESKIYHLFNLADARQDDFTSRTNPETGEKIEFFGEANFAETLAKLLKGTDGAVFLDYHSRRALNWFDSYSIPYVNITAAGKFAEWLNNNHFTQDDPDTIIALCDYGDAPRGLELSKRTGIPVRALIRKIREDQKVTANLELGNVEKKTVIIWDDMISSGGTIKRDVDLLFEQGAKEVVFIATHPVFSGEYRQNIKYLKDKFGEKLKIVITNSILVERDNMPHGVEQIDITDLIVDTAQILLNSSSFREAVESLKDKNYFHELLSPDDAIEEITRLQNLLISESQTIFSG